jgi:hypothetical protein
MRLLVYACFLLSALAFAQSDQPAAADRDRVLKAASDFARDYIDRLPDFVCQRVTQHNTRKSVAEAWKPQIKLAEELTFYGRKEHYRIVAVNDQPATKMPRIGNWVGSSGDFGEFLHALFDPKSRAIFEWKGREMIRDKRVWTFSYHSPAGYSITDCQSVLIVGTCKTHEYPYHGTVSILEDPLQIVRLTVEPDNVPQNQESRSIDYDRVTIAGSEYLLPITDTFERVRDKVYFHNESVYRDYRKFGSESTIKAIPDGVR